MLKIEDIVLEKLARSLKMKDLETTMATLSAIKKILASERIEDMVK